MCEKRFAYQHLSRKCVHFVERLNKEEYTTNDS